MSVQLRQYQVDIISQARELMRQGVRSVLIQSPTGSGKTLLTAKMIGTAREKGLSAWFTVHRRELIRQSILAFDKVGIPHGVVSAGWITDLRHSIQIASVQTLMRRHNRMRAPKLIVVDECHHIAARSWAKLFAEYPNAFLIGLTATPERLDGTGLDKWFKAMVKGPSVSWLIENGFLSQYRLYAPSSISTEGIHTRMGDFVQSELCTVVDKPLITGDAIKHYRRHADGKRAVCFCVSVMHSKHVVEQFNAAGIPAAHVDGESPPEVRDDAIKKFAEGKIKILSNVELFGEGFDLPSIEAAILLRPTQSLGLYLQQVGRALRPSLGKSYAVILDHAGNCQRHGLPDDDRVWSLLGRDSSQARKGNGGLSVKVCPKCFGAQFAGRPACKLCGFVFEIQAREVDQVEGDLIEVDPATVRRQRAFEQSRANDLQSLIELGRKRGYKRAELWARHVYMARQTRKLAGIR